MNTEEKRTSSRRRRLGRTRAGVKLRLFMNMTQGNSPMRKTKLSEEVSSVHPPTLTSTKTDNG